uniref:Homeobox domain-containing protein n=1 Tax=Heligmosomoides polygyrus TaxID=6339 RepID=A0A183FY98_HELPZ
LFALHDQGEGLEKTLSLPNLLGSTGLMDHRDQQDWMDFVVETSGAADVIEKTKTKREKEAAKNNVRKVRGPDGQPIYFTKENVTKLYGAFEASKIEVFEQLQKTFTPEQVSVYFSVQGLSSLTVLKFLKAINVHLKDH